jgi:tartrate dehydrogenase/decarboxylase/D-malate dehydrogenase
MYKIATIGGDGIGPEIVTEGKKVLEAAGEQFNFDIEWTDFDIGADRYLSNGELLTETIWQDFPNSKQSISEQ